MNYYKYKKTTIFGSQSTHTFVTQEFKKLQANEIVNPAIRGAVLKSSAFIYGEYAFNSMSSQLEQVQGEQELLHIVNTLGRFKEEQIIMKIIELVLMKIPLRNEFNAIHQMSGNLFMAPYFGAMISKFLFNAY